MYKTAKSKYKLKHTRLKTTISRPMIACFSSNNQQMVHPEPAHTNNQQMDNDAIAKPSEPAFTNNQQSTNGP